jgi:hypothetical protein
MIDYDLPFVDHDKQEMRKEGFIVEDKEKNEMVRYQDLFEKVGPKQKAANLQELSRVVTVVQRYWRGFMARRFVKTIRDNEMVDLTQTIKDASSKKMDPTRAQAKAAGADAKSEKTKQANAKAALNKRKE